MKTLYADDRGASPNEIVATTLHLAKRAPFMHMALCLKQRARGTLDDAAHSYAVEICWPDLSQYVLMISESNG